MSRPTDPRDWPIYRDHVAAIRAFAARRVERDAVEDVVADTFTIAWRKLHGDERDPLPWLYAVAGKVIHGHRRSLARRHLRLRRALGGEGSRHGCGADQLIVDDPQLALAFARLTAREREAICLLAWDGLSLAQAAGVARCSTGTLKVRYSRAKAKLAQALDELDRAPAPDPAGHTSTPTVTLSKEPA